jgi:hypothetical protein
MTFDVTYINPKEGTAENHDQLSQEIRFSGRDSNMKTVEILRGCLVTTH